MHRNKVIIAIVNLHTIMYYTVFESESETKETRNYSAYFRFQNNLVTSIETVTNK